MSRGVVTSLAFLFACGEPRVAPPPASPSPVDAPLEASASPAHVSTRVRLCTFPGHHGYAGLTVALEASCGERSATCTVASPPLNGEVVRELDVSVVLSPPSDATCADRGTRVTSTCTLPATSTASAPGRYPTATSRLLPRGSLPVRVNGREEGKLTTDAAGRPEPAEQCWNVAMP